MMRSGSTTRTILLATALLGIQGCAAAALVPATVGPAVASSTGSLIRAGTEYRANGVLLRTFRVPVAQVHDVALETLRRFQMQVSQDGVNAEGGQLVARAKDRTIHISLEPITPVVTQMRVVVSRGLFRRDRATASELLTAIDQRVYLNQGEGQ